MKEKNLHNNIYLYSTVLPGIPVSWTKVVITWQSYVQIKQNSIIWP